MLPPRDLTNAANLDSSAGQGAERRLCSRSRGLGLVTSSGAQLDVQGSDTELLRMPHGEPISWPEQIHVLVHVNKSLKPDLSIQCNMQLSTPLLHGM